MDLVRKLKSLPGSLARVTSGGKMISEVDGLRFVAIFPVILQHLGERLERNTLVSFHENAGFHLSTFVINRGFIGVYIFFVISGFILGLPFANYFLAGGRKVSIRNYFWRRLTRLEPPYILVMSVITIFLVVMGSYTWKEIWPHFLASIFYVHSLVYHSWSYINPPVWTLEIEVQFYILAPLLAAIVFFTKGKVFRRVLLLFFILSIMLLQQHYDVLHSSKALTILGHLQYFLLGFILADIYLIDWKDKLSKHEFFNYLFIFSMCVAIYSWSWDFTFESRFVFTASLFLLVYSSFRSTWINTFLTSSWISGIGGMCYTIYLIHLPIIEFMIKITNNVWFTDSYIINFVIQFFLIVPVILGISIVFFLLVEKPCMDKNWPSQLKNYLANFTKRG